MNFIKKITFLMFSLSAFSVFAGEATVTGEARVSVDPDYVSLTLNLASECYDTPGLASTANDAKVAQVVGYLETLVDLSEGSNDAVLANGGYTQPFTRTVYSHRGQDSVTVCKGTFQKRSTVVLKTTDVKNFGATLAEIQEHVFSGHNTAPVENEDPLTYVSIGRPTPQLFHETRLRTEKNMLRATKLDALEKFEILVGGPCGVSHYEITGFSEPNSGLRPMPYAKRSFESSDGGSSSAPVVFDSQWISKAVNFEFSFEGGHCESAGFNHYTE